MVLNNITYLQILGRPLIFYLGIITLLSFLFTASIPRLSRKGKMNFKWHPRMAKFSISLAIIHGGLGALAYF